MLTFGHAGESGDLIYGLPCMQILGGGELILHKYVTQGPCQPRGFSESLFRNVKPLLEVQEGVEKLTYQTCPPFVDVDMNRFRFHWAKLYVDLYKGRGWNASVNIQQMHLIALNLEPIDETKPWLKVPENNSKAYEIVVNRSFRYRNHKFPWKALLERYKGCCAFVGSLDELKDFEKHFGSIQYVPCLNLLEVAQVIDKCSLFIGNQSCPCAIAEGLKKPLIQETFLPDPNCMFARANVKYSLEGSVL